MHRNHRRTGHRTKKSSRHSPWCRPYSLAEWKRGSAKAFRARQRGCLADARWEDLVDKILKDHLWDYY